MRARVAPRRPRSTRRPRRGQGARWAHRLFPQPYLTFLIFLTSPDLTLFCFQSFKDSFHKSQEMAKAAAAQLDAPAPPPAPADAPVSSEDRRRARSSGEGADANAGSMRKRRSSISGLPRKERTRTHGVFLQRRHGYTPPAADGAPTAAAPGSSSVLVAAGAVDPTDVTDTSPPAEASVVDRRVRAKLEVYRRRREQTALRRRGGKNADDIQDGEAAMHHLDLQVTATILCYGHHHPLSTISSSLAPSVSLSLSFSRRRRIPFPHPLSLSLRPHPHLVSPLPPLPLPLAPPAQLLPGAERAYEYTQRLAGRRDGVNEERYAVEARGSRLLRRIEQQAKRREMQEALMNAIEEQSRATLEEVEARNAAMLAAATGDIGARMADREANLQRVYAKVEAEYALQHSWFVAAQCLKALKEPVKWRRATSLANKWRMRKWLRICGRLTTLDRSIHKYYRLRTMLHVLFGWLYVTADSLARLPAGLGKSLKKRRERLTLFSRLLQAERNEKCPRCLFARWSEWVHYKVARRAIVRCSRERLDARLLGRCFAALSAGIQASRARTTDQTTTDDAVADIDVEGYHGGALELRYVLATPLSDHPVPLILPDPPSPSPRGDTWQMGIGAG